MAKLCRAVFLRGRLLLPGEEPEPRLAALITNPGAWEDGKLPTAAKKATEADTKTETTPEPAKGDAEDSDTKPAARKAAARPARGRKSADEGSS